MQIFIIKELQHVPAARVFVATQLHFLPAPARSALVRVADAAGASAVSGGGATIRVSTRDELACLTVHVLLPNALYAHEDGKLLALAMIAVGNVGGGVQATAHGLHVEVPVDPPPRVRNRDRIVFPEFVLLPTDRAALEAAFQWVEALGMRRLGHVMSVVLDPYAPRPDGWERTSMHQLGSPEDVSVVQTGTSNDLHCSLTRTHVVDYAGRPVVTLHRLSGAWPDECGNVRRLS